MITRITEKNAQQYRVLFDKAAKKLRADKPSSLNEAVADYFGKKIIPVPADASFNSTYTYYIRENNQYIIQENLTEFAEDVVYYYSETSGWDAFSIDSLDEYYAYLRNLVDITGQTEDEKAFYVRLPLDEDVFAIDANTRNISIPSSFARNGVGVQGDEMAEILYFTIDRYFDAVDLANSNILIAIQWEARNAQRETIAGISRNFGKDVESLPGKIIFGWPISSELTEANSTIKFAVRFYTITENENHEKTFTYSFATLPAEITINQTLNYDLTGTILELNHGIDILNRINSDGIHNANMPIPGKPIITLKDITTDNKMFALNNIGKRIIDLPIDNSGVDLAIAAQPTAADHGTSLGAIGYKWKQYSYAGNGNYSSTFGLVENENISVDYLAMTSELQAGYDYYERSGAGTENDPYNYIIAKGLTSDLNYYYYDKDNELTTDETNNPVGYKKLDGNYYPILYKKISKANVKQTGIYTVDINSKNLANTVTKEMSLEDGIKIPGPLTPVVTLITTTDSDVITTDEDGITSAHILVGTTATQLKVEAITGETGKSTEAVGENPQVTLSYQWKQVNNGIATNIANTEDITYTSTTTENANILTIEGLEGEELDVSYQVTVTSTRNGVSTSKDSGIYRITNTPTKPIIKIRKIENNQLVWDIRDYTHEVNQIPATLRNGQATLTVRADKAIQSDGFSYYWMKLNIDENDIQEGQTIYQIDLANDGEVVDGLTDKILSIFPDKAGEADTLIVNNFGEFATIVAAEDENDVDNYQTSYDATEPGVYYCLIINNLNQHINANASPFFVVQ